MFSAMRRGFWGGAPTVKRRRARRNSSYSSARRRLRGKLEQLEDRLVLATFTVSNLNDAGAGSLRQAIIDANGLAGADIVEFDPTVVGTITLTTGQIDITDELEIQGPGAGDLDVDGNANSRIFDINIPDPGEFNVSISGLTLRNGRAIDGDEDDGGAIRVSSANIINLQITEAIISDNNANDDGGGIYFNNGTLTIEGTTISGNDAANMGADGNGGGGGIMHQSGAIQLLQDSTLSGNTSSLRGGGLYLGTGTLTIEDTTVDMNMADAAGGGIRVNQTNDGGITIRNSSITSNTAGSHGGGLDLVTISDAVLFEEVTITGNSTGTGNGAGLRITSVLSGASVQITQNSVISGNTAGAAGGAAYINNLSSLTSLVLSDAYIAYNTAGTFAGGFYLDGAGSATISGTTITRNMALNGFGGAIRTSVNQLTIDQSEFSENSASVHGGAINADDGNVTLTESSVTGNFTTIGSGGGLYINGAGLTVTDSDLSGNTAEANGGALATTGSIPGPHTLDGTTITDNMAKGDGGGIWLNDPISNLPLNEAVLFTNDTDISNNTAGYSPIGEMNAGDGGGLFALNAAPSASMIGMQVALQTTTISGNTATRGDGGGIFAHDTSDDEYQPLIFTIDRTTISGNTADKGGGIYHLNGGMALSNSTISGNTATLGNGGGIYRTNDSMGMIADSSNIFNSTITLNNVMSGEGGGIYATNLIDDATELTSTIIGGNTATSNPDIGGLGVFEATTSIIEDPGTANLMNMGGVQTGVDPGLLPLADNGGPTLTHALDPTSPAIDAGSNPNAQPTDQRGFAPRTIGDATDVGSFELGALGPRDDLTTFNEIFGNWNTFISTGTSFTGQTWDNWSDGGWLLSESADFDNDGLTDVAGFNANNATWWVGLSDGTTFNSSLWADYSEGGWTLSTSGDFDGDGLVDIATFNERNNTWWVGLSDGTTFTTTHWGNLPASEGGIPTNWTNAVSGDFDGDGEFDDIAAFNAAQATWYVGISNGSMFTFTSWASFSVGGWTDFLTGDFNNDGQTDIANFNENNSTWWVSLSEGNQFDTDLWADYSDGGWTHKVSGDFDLDGLTDVATFNENNATWWVGLSDGTTFGTTLWADYSDGGGWSIAVAGDFDGDGRTDITNFNDLNRTWWTGLSDGEAFGTSLWFNNAPFEIIQFTHSGMFTDDSNLQFAGAAVEAAEDVEGLTEAALAEAVALSIDAWSQTGIDVEPLLAASFEIRDLPGNLLGTAVADRVFIDIDAAGHGWFVDPTPAVHEEFDTLGGTRELRGTGDAAGGVDLMTAVTHELGHLLGFDDLNPAKVSDHVMTSTLGTGARRLPWSEAVDAVFRGG